jgi:CRP-like cAMP-binding protein
LAYKKTAAVQSSELRGLGLELSPAKLELLRRHMTALRVRKGEMLYRPGEPATHIYCVLDGAVGLTLLGSNGRLVQLGLRTKGEFLGETALVPGWRRLSEAKALEDSRVGQVEVATLVSKVWDLPWEKLANLTKTLLSPVLLRSLRRSLFLVERLPDRLALVLWENAGHSEARRARGRLPSTLTHEELAAMVGASRPRVSLALKRLEKAGLFIRDGRRIRVQETPLRAYLDGKYESLL